MLGIRIHITLIQDRALIKLWIRFSPMQVKKKSREL
jgi:hypothetical protein